MFEFDDDVVEKAWDRAKGHCECTRKTHGISGRCNKQLVWANRGRQGRGCWEAHHINSNRPGTLSNCEILCWDCHAYTL
jgi:hypothetical protein